MYSRRSFIAILGEILLIPLFLMCRRKSSLIISKKSNRSSKSEVFRAVNGSPKHNVGKVIELAGGIHNIVGPDDVVIIKPNLQWWNHGAPNIAVCKALVDIIMNRNGGFTGEVVIAENTHRGKEPWKKTGWSTKFSVNSELRGINNYNELCCQLKNDYGEHFTVSHWIDADSGGKRVYGPKDGSGYVYCDGTGGVPLICLDNGLIGKSMRKVIMSYPVFKTDKGTSIDFKNGVWSDGSYSKQQIKFINLVALNHHSTYCGMTSSIKNYFGITDISNGANPLHGGKLTAEYYNFHAFAYNEWAKGPVPGIMGAEVGMFMNNIRKADLNIVTAEWVGLASRTDRPIAQTRAVLASTDPVALDYHSSKYVLYPNSQCKHHDPDWIEGPLFQYINQCAIATGYILDEQFVNIVSFDFNKKELKSEGEMQVQGAVDWGTDPKVLLKYLMFRFGNKFLI